MRRKLFLLIVFVCFVINVGCVCVSQDIYWLANDVAQIQQETSSALIESIDEDLSTTNRTNKEKQMLNDLRDRLSYLSDANSAIVRYLAHELSVEELAKLMERRDQFLKEQEGGP